jgi:hypothetical protein
MNSNQPPTTSTTLSNRPSAEIVSRRAYEIWEQQGRPEGNDLQHWLQAEQELNRGNASQPTSATRSQPVADTKPLQGTRAAPAPAQPKRNSGTPFGTEKVAASNRQPAGVSRK